MPHTLHPPEPIERIMLIKPRPDVEWEKGGTINPGVARLPDGTVAMVYRATGEGGMGYLGFCRLDPDARELVAGSRSDTPLCGGSADEGQEFPDGYADPRMNKVGDWYYIWAAGRNDRVLAESRDKFDNDFSGQYIGGRQITAFRTKDFIAIEPLGLYGPDEFDKNAFLHPEPVVIEGEAYLALFHRIQFSVQVAVAKQIEDYGSRRFWREHMARLNDYLFAEPIAEWEGIGAAAQWPGQIAGGSPPLEINAALLGDRKEAGKRYWLLFYNASGPPRKGTYPKDRTVGAIVYTQKVRPSLSSQPFEIIARSPEPLLRAKEPYEIDSSCGAVVFATGALLTTNKEAVDVFYGSGDTAVSKARFGLSSLMQYMRQFDGRGQHV